MTRAAARPTSGTAGSSSDHRTATRASSNMSAGSGDTAGRASEYSHR